MQECPFDNPIEDWCRHNNRKSTFIKKGHKKKKSKILWLLYNDFYQKIFKLKNYFRVIEIIELIILKKNKTAVLSWWLGI